MDEDGGWYDDVVEGVAGRRARCVAVVGGDVGGDASGGDGARWCVRRCG